MNMKKKITGALACLPTANKHTSEKYCTGKIPLTRFVRSPNALYITGFLSGVTSGKLPGTKASIATKLHFKSENFRNVWQSLAGGDNLLFFFYLIYGLKLSSLKSFQSFEQVSIQL